MPMPIETLTIHLPGVAMRRLRRVAEIARRPVDEVVAETLQSGLPPLLEDVPTKFHPDLARLENLSSAALHEHMRASLNDESVARYEALQVRLSAGRLSEGEQQEWEVLGFEADGLMFCKAYAALLLKWRGEHIPSLLELESPN